MSTGKPITKKLTKMSTGKPITNFLGVNQLGLKISGPVGRPLGRLLIKGWLF